MVVSVGLKNGCLGFQVIIRKKTWMPCFFQNFFSSVELRSFKSSVSRHEDFDLSGAPDILSVFFFGDEIRSMLYGDKLRSHFIRIPNENQPGWRKWYPFVGSIGETGGWRNQIQSQIYEPWKRIKKKNLPCFQPVHQLLGGGNSNIFGIFTPNLGVSWSNLTNIFFWSGLKAPSRLRFLFGKTCLP